MWVEGTVIPPCVSFSERSPLAFLSRHKYDREIGIIHNTMYNILSPTLKSKKDHLFENYNILFMFYVAYKQHILF